VFAVGEEQPAFEPHLALLPAHGLLLVDLRTVLVEEAVLRRAPWRVTAHRSPAMVRPAAERGSGGALIMDRGHLLPQVVGGSAGAAVV
jgi:hypothetical protein